MNPFRNLFKDRELEQRELLRQARRRVRRSIQDVHARIAEAEQADGACRDQIKDALRAGQDHKARQLARMAGYKAGRVHRLGNMALMLAVISDNLADKSAFQDTLGLIQGSTSLAPLSVSNLETAFDSFTQQLENDADLHQAVSQALGLSLKADDTDTASPDRILGEIEAELHGSDATAKAPKRDRELDEQVANGRAAVERLKSALADKKQGE